MKSWRIGAGRAAAQIWCPCFGGAFFFIFGDRIAVYHLVVPAPFFLVYLANGSFRKTVPLPTRLHQRKQLISSGEKTLSGMGRRHDTSAHSVSGSAGPGLEGNSDCSRPGKNCVGLGLSFSAAKAVMERCGWIAWR